jgi:hypothetical protein
MPARERDGGALAEQEARAYRETFGKGGVSHAQQAHAAAPSGALWDRYDHGAQSHLGAPLLTRVCVWTFACARARAHAHTAWLLCAAILRR